MQLTEQEKKESEIISWYVNRIHDCRNKPTFTMQKRAIGRIVKEIYSYSFIQWMEEWSKIQNKIIRVLFEWITPWIVIALLLFIILNKQCN